MSGISMDLSPEFPTDADMILLTESAKNERDIVAKIKSQLRAGKSAALTSVRRIAISVSAVRDPASESPRA